MSQRPSPTHRNVRLFLFTDGGLDVFFGGLEALLGPPQVVKDPDADNQMPTIRKSMENEHTVSYPSTSPVPYCGSIHLIECLQMRPGAESRVCTRS